MKKILVFALALMLAVPALAFAGAYDALTGFRLACARGSFMAEAAKEHDATMAAVVKLSDETVERLCAAYEHVYPVNYNCDGQVAVAGERAQLEKFYDDVAAAGGRSGRARSRFLPAGPRRRYRGRAWSRGGRPRPRRFAAGDTGRH